MRVSPLWLAASLWSGSALALPDASLEPWFVHDSCNGFENDLKDALTQSIEMADAARSALEIVSGKMPDPRSDEDGAVQWSRIAFTVQVIFGYMPSRSGSNAAATQYSETLRDIYAKAVRVLPSSQNDPAQGNNPTLAARPNAKPIIACGDGVFKWFDADKEPAPGVGKVSDQPEFKRREQANNRPAGAFYFEGRWAFKSTTQTSFGVCMGNREAVISSHDDLIILCDKITSDAGKARTSPRDFKASAGAGSDLRDALISNPTQIWHELCHWFGGVNGRLEHNIKDHPAVDKNGKVLYKGNGAVVPFDAPPSAQDLQRNGLRKQGAYGIGNVMELALNHRRLPGNSGPDKATTNADSLMIFSLMMYNDRWDWTIKGRARDLTRIREKLGLSNP
ncbi:hypothetical protein FSARC_11736 [Fusarium sarcochroum]|uniref:Lysine-specific metallo-endopeptidase domain-containing protein n=1 Tax=Fusarium sarcochroum TaxID=1208366 RepID=A0A8H4WZY9_9HYPO|nr:hypothetical protein FSARC_11736 [Fusarium sarcochroum]